jgi:hypothetical protein
MRLWQLLSWRTREENIHSADSAFELEEFAAAAAAGGRRQSRTRGDVAYGLRDSARPGLHLRGYCTHGRISRSRPPGRIGVEGRSQGAESALASSGRCRRPHRLSEDIARTQRTSPTPARGGGFSTERPRDTFRHVPARRAVANSRAEGVAAWARGDQASISRPLMLAAMRFLSSPCAASE